jgi:hypothetical protein
LMYSRAGQEATNGTDKAIARSATCGALVR